jgi:hypothetical protein
MKNLIISQLIYNFQILFPSKLNIFLENSDKPLFCKRQMIFLQQRNSFNKNKD